MFVRQLHPHLAAHLLNETVTASLTALLVPELLSNDGEIGQRPICFGFNGSDLATSFLFT
jgi:hypothetical protein